MTNLSIKLLSAALASLALCGGASAAVIHFIEDDGTVPAGGIPIATNYAGVSVDLETGDTSYALGGFTNGDANFYFGGARISNDADAAAAEASWQPVRTGTGNTDSISNLSFGTLVSAASTYHTVVPPQYFGSSSTHITGTAPVGFDDNVSGYIGFSLIPNGGGSPWYGWMRVTLRDDNGNAGTIHEWAYEDSGADILVGAIPEPGTGALALLGLGAFALRRRRR